MKLLVKLGGTLLDAADSRDRLARQIAGARSAGHEIVVVHGGGKQMTRYLAERGIRKPLRRTDCASPRPETLDAVLKVFAGSVNHELVAAMNRAGALAVGITGIDAFLVGGRADGSRRSAPSAASPIQPRAAAPADRQPASCP